MSFAEVEKCKLFFEFSTIILVSEGVVKVNVQELRKFTLEGKNRLFTSYRVSHVSKNTWHSIGAGNALVSVLSKSNDAVDAGGCGLKPSVAL